MILGTMDLWVDRTHKTPWTHEYYILLSREYNQHNNKTYGILEDGAYKEEIKKTDVLSGIGAVGGGGGGESAVLGFKSSKRRSYWGHNRSDLKEVRE